MRGSKATGSKSRQPLDRDRHPLCGGEPIEEVGERGFHRLQSALVGIAHIDGEGRARRDHVDRIGLEGDAADRRHARSVRAGDVITQISDHPGRREPGVAAHRHRRGSRVVGDALDGDAPPRDALDVLHRADGHALAIEDRALLDMEFDIGVRPQEAKLVRAGIADALEFGAERGAVGCDRGQRVLDPEAAHIGQRAQHVRREAHALFVGEGGDRDSHAPA